MTTMIPSWRHTVRAGLVATLSLLGIACGRIGYDELDTAGPPGPASGAGATNPIATVAVGSGAIGGSTGLGTQTGSGGASGMQAGSGGASSSAVSSTSGAWAGSSTTSAGGADGGSAGSSGSAGIGVDAGAKNDAGFIDGPDSGPSTIFQFVSIPTMKCLDVRASSIAEGAELVLNPCTGGSNQLFMLGRLASGTFTITDVNSGQCLDAPNATSLTRVSQRTCAGVASQSFALQLGIDTVVSQASSGLCVEVFGGITVDGTTVNTWTCHAGTNQTWRLEAAATGGCAPESDAAFCTRLGAACDRWTGTDNCGATRTVVCGPCVPLLQACGMTTPNACGNVGKVNLARGGTVTASTPGSAPKDMRMAFDENPTTEWFASGATTGWIAYQFAAGARNIVTSYTVTSSPDWPDTDPRDWTMEGSNGATWTVLDRRTIQVFLSRGETKLYSFSNATSYNSYRLNISANHGSTLNLHLAEVQLFR